MIPVISTIPLVDFALLVLLGTFVLVLNGKNMVNRTYGFTCLVGAIISISEYGITTANGHGTIIFWVLVFSLWPSQLSCIVYFVLCLTGRAESFKKLKLAYKLILFSAWITSFVYFYTRFTSVQWVKAGWGWVEAFHALPLADIYVIAWSTFICVLILVLGLITYAKTGEKKKKTLLGIVILACAIQLIINILTKGILPALLKTPFPDYVSFGLTAQAAIIAWAIWKYGLFQLNPATAAEAILSAMDGALLLCDPGFHIVRINQAAIRMFRFSESELRRLPLDTLIDRGDMDRLAFSGGNRLEKGSGPGLVTVVTVKGGKKIDVTVSASELKDNTGGTAGYVVIINDISQLVKTENDLRESEERFKAIFEGSSDAVMLLTDKGFFDCNPATLEMFGFRKKEEFTNVHPADISPPFQPDGTESFPAAMERIKTAFETGSNRFEWVHRRASGEDFPAEVLLTAFDMNGKRVLQATVRDITSRKRAEIALQESETKYRALVETTGTGFLILDSKGRVLDANPEYVRLSGHGQLREILGRSVVEWTAAHSRKRNAEAVALCVKDGFVRNLVLDYVDKSGMTIPVEINATVDGAGENMRISSLCRDITERKQAEEALRLSEEKLRRIFENLQDVYYETSLDGTIIEISPSIEIVSKGQYHRNDMIGRSMSDLYADDGQRQVLLSELKKRGSVADFEITLKNRDGSLVPCSISSKIGFDAEGRPKSIMGSMRDITERKRTEDALRKSEAVMRGIYSAAPVGISVSSNRIMQTINEQLCQISGYPAEELIGKSARKYYVDDSEYERVGRELYGSDGHGRFGNVEARWRRKDGTLIDVIISMAPMDSADPSAGEVVTVLDITKRKKAERELQESEVRFNTAFVHSPVSMSITCAATAKYVEANENFFRDTGFARDQVIGHTSAELGLFSDPDDRQRLVAQARSQGFVKDMEIRFRVKTGEIRDCLISTQPITLNGEPHFLLTAVDITERKRVEEALRKSEAMLRGVYLAAPVGITVSNKREIESVNGWFTKMSGFSVEEMVGKSARIYFPDDAEYERVGRELYGRGGNVEARLQRKDGTLFDVLLSIAALDPHDPSAGNVLTALDITERKRAERSLAESEQSFRSMFDITPEGVVLISPNTGRFVAVNPAMRTLLGYSEEEFLSLSPEDITPPEAKEIMRCSIAQLEEGRSTADHEGITLTKDGSKVNVLVGNRLLQWHGEKVYYTTFKDITKRKRAEIALAESEKNFRVMFEASTDALNLVGIEDGRFLEVNNAMCLMFGYSREELLCMSPRDLIDKANIPEQNEVRTEVLKRGSVASDEGTVVRKRDGTMLQVLISAQIVAWKGRRVIHSSLRDITPLKQVQEQLKKKNSEILEFTDMVTHDLKKPLTTMNIVLGLAKKGMLGPLSPDGLDAVDTGVEASRYMQEMLEDLLACARLESGTQELTVEKIGFRELAEEVMRKLKFQIEEKKISVSAREGDISVMADRKHLTRVLMNLVGNAINYIGSGPDKVIRIGWEQKNGSPEFFVSDNGIGIPEASRPGLFGKFKRGSNVAGVQGTGLGLSIVKGIVEAHGGKIWFASDVGKGTTFHFTLAGKEAKS